MKSTDTLTVYLYDDLALTHVEKVVVNLNNPGIISWNNLLAGKYYLSLVRSEKPYYYGELLDGKISVRINNI